MQGLGKSQYEAFAGLDVQQNCMNTNFSSNYLLNNSNKLKLSLALYCPNSTMGLSGDGADFHEVERQFYVNGGDPRSTSSSGWAGMSRFFADHTTIISAPFVTNFNSGHGKAFYIDGVKSRDAEWSYQSVQDVMPTWTWIIDSNGQKLSGAYDFEDAYNGGSSIKFYGSLTANKPNNIMLYSTNLDINGSTNIAVTAKNDRGLMKLVAYYGDSSTSSYANCQKATFALAMFPSLPSAAKNSMRSALKSAAQAMFPTIRSTSAGLPSPIPKRRLQAQAMQGLPCCCIL